MRNLGILLSILFASAVSPALAQKAPEMGYVYPPAVSPGTSVDVVLGVYDWTPDMQLFVHDERVKLVLTGPPGEVLVPPPPYWFGPKGLNPAMMQPREFPARLEIPAGMPAGPVHWQAANANGVTAVGTFLIQARPHVLEDASEVPQMLPPLPVSVSGRVFKIEEVDRYRFQAPRDGLVHCTWVHRGVEPRFRPILEVRTTAGEIVAGSSDTASGDTVLSFLGQAGAEYELSLHDVDFNGDRSFVYHLEIDQDPRILAAVPAAGQRGATQEIEFLGYGLTDGGSQLERLRRSVIFPNEPGLESFEYRLETPRGAAVCKLLLSDFKESVAAAEGSEPVRLSPPAAITGHFQRPAADYRYLLEAKKGDIWKITAQAAAISSPADPVLTVYAADGQQLAANDDLPGTLDAGLDFKVPADGLYTVAVGDNSAAAGSTLARYRLLVYNAGHVPPGLSISAPQAFSAPIGGKAELLVKAVRSGEWKGPITLSLAGLPEGMTAPAEAVIPAEKSELKVPLEVAADAPALASRVTLSARAQAGELTLNAVAAPLVVASTMKPRVKISPVDKDGGRTVHRGTTYPAAVIVERLEGFDGEVLLQMAAKQGRHRQGIRGPELVVPPGVDRIEYPVTMPEWLETARTSRMVLIGVTQVADPRGNRRWLVSPMDGRITMSIEGALLKLSHVPRELTVRPGEPFEVPLTISRSPKLPEKVRLELVGDGQTPATFTAAATEVAADQTEATLRIDTLAGATCLGEQEVTIRATALQPGNLPVISETTLTVIVAPTADR